MTSYLRTRRADRRPCLCGQEIVYTGAEPLQAVVAAHNRTPGHIDWWERVRVLWQPWLAVA